MALIVHTKIFISEIVEKEQYYISDSPKALNESIIHSYIYFKFPVLYGRVFESIATIAPYHRSVC